MIYKTIEELTTVVTGGTPSTSKAEYWENGNIPWLQSGCCQNCDVNQADKFISQSGYDNSSTQVMPVNTVMIALTGATAGKVGYLNIEACGNQSITGVFPCEELNPRFLFYFLISQRRKILVDCVGGAQAHISQGYVKKIKVPVYSKNLQERIVNIMNICSKNIKHYEMILKEYDELVKARFVEMFGDPVSNSKHLPLKTLPQLGTFGRGVSKYRPRNAPELLNGPYPLIQTGDIANSELYIKNYNNTYSEVGLKQSKMWDKGTLCITIAANIAKTAILQFDACFPDSVVGFNGNNLIDNIFVHYWFSFFQEILENQAPESAQKNINLKILSELQIITPDIIEQNQFANFVRQVDKSREEVKRSLEKTQKLYDSLMQEYFG